MKGIFSDKKSYIRNGITNILVIDDPSWQHNTYMFIWHQYYDPSDIAVILLLHGHSGWPDDLKQLLISPWLLKQPKWLCSCFDYYQRYLSSWQKITNNNWFSPHTYTHFLKTKKIFYLRKYVCVSAYVCIFV